MDLKKRIWLDILSSLMSAKNDKWITDDEYNIFKEKLKNWLDNKENCEEKYTDYSSYENCLSKDDLIDLLESFFDLDDEAVLSEINKLKRIDLYHLLDIYNWDDGFSIPSQILKHPDCDMALAMKIFDLADGVYFIEKCFIEKETPSQYDDWWDFCLKLFNELGSAKFKMDDTPIELCAGLKIALLKQGVVNKLTQDYKFLFDNL